MSKKLASETTSREAGLPLHVTLDYVRANQTNNVNGDFQVPATYSLPRECDRLIVRCCSSVGSSFVPDPAFSRLR
jgi:hypothetical protein